MKIFIKYLLLLIFIAIGFSYGEEYTIEKILSKVICTDEIMVAELEYAAGMEEVKIYQSEAMPQITFSGNSVYSAQSIEAMKASGNPIASVVGETGKYKYFDGVALNWSLNLYQPLITFGKVLNALKIGGVRKELLGSIRQNKKEMYYFSVIIAFGNTYIAQKNISIANNSFELAKIMLNRVSIDLATGNGIRRDSLTLQANLYKTQSDLQLAKSVYKISLRRLRKMTELIIPDESKYIYSKTKWASLIPEDKDTIANMGIVLKQHERDMLLYKSEYQKGNILPSIGLTGNVANSIFRPSNDIRDFLRNKSAANLTYISPNYKDILNSKYFNFSIGLQMDWNIFDGRRSFATYKQSRLNFEKSDRELKILTEQNEDDISEARDNIDVLESVQKAVDLQLEAIKAAFEQTQEDYKNGFTDHTTLLDLDYKLREAEMKVSQLEIQWLIAVSEYKLILGMSLVR